MHRFFVQTAALSAPAVTLTGDVAHQIGRVLRMRVDDVVVLLDGSGLEYEARLAEFRGAQIDCDILGSTVGTCEPLHRVDAYLALLNKPDKFEWALQKCTELGAANFTPVVCERSVPGTPEQGRRERWERIIKEAAEQSGRCVLPQLHAAMPFGEAVKQEEMRLVKASGGSAIHLALLPAPGAELSISAALLEAGEAASVSLFIGPEGGFAEDELRAATERGIRLVNLGPRTLRSETAAIAALVMIMDRLGELG
jgi:16S rRNA (uracil1498-N3)-methyltransferase